MDEQRLRQLLRRVVLLSLSVPLVGSFAACGNSTSSTTDAGHPCTGPICCTVPPPLDIPVAQAGLTDGSVSDAGDVDTADCQRLCTGGTYCGCRVTTDDAGTAVVACQPCLCTGRRPAGLKAVRARGGAGSVGAYFAEAARLEAASVTAFEVLRAELSAHGAPRPLLRAARRARRDEVRHARVMGELARRFGVREAAPRVAPRPLRPLEEVAVENAVEGCIRETWGALSAAWQARAAADARVRSVFCGIARDEARHAALAYRVARWAEPRLTTAARRRVCEAGGEAAVMLARELAAEPPADVARVAGVPTAARAQALFDRMRSELASVS